MGNKYRWMRRKTPQLVKFVCDTLIWRAPLALETRVKAIVFVLVLFGIVQKW